MICRRCLIRFARRNDPLRSLHRSRTLATSPNLSQSPVTADTTTATARGAHDIPSATTSTTATQSAGIATSSSQGAELPAPGNVESKPAMQSRRSSVPAGTVLKGLNFMKNKTDPVALEDSEYPDWLWTVLERSGNRGADDVDAGEGDLFSKSKKQRRLAAKALRKQQLLDPGSLIPKVPLEEQTVDLPAGNESPEGIQEANTARQDLTKAMRDRRRKDIKEANFLKAMR